jgi:3-deoxy-manno-octulosonate cytidylyltransferase (CMP-KDO synthetase)
LGIVIAAKRRIGKCKVNPVVVIPARMASSRLPGKPLAEIAGVPMIVRVWRRAVDAGVGPVVVAAAEREIAVAIEAAGGRAVMTSPDLPSGSDRVHAALDALADTARFDAVINLQGDLPALDPDAIRAAADALAASGADIATLAAEIRDAAEADNRSVVKAVVSWNADGRMGRARDFVREKSRAGAPPWFHHVGIYAYRRAALARFVALPPSPREKEEKLEQLRALEAGMTIWVARIGAVPLSVDTPEDLARARRALA